MTARAGLLLACLALLPWPATAQGIGDAAAREKERRSREEKAKGKTAEPATYTNDDLANGKTTGKKDAAGQPASEASPPTEPRAERASPGPLAERAAAEQEYQDAVTSAQKQVDTLEARARELQAMLNPMSSTYIYGGTGGASGNDEIRVRNELRDNEAQLAAAQQALEAAKSALSEFRLGRRPPPRRDTPTRE